MVKIFSCYGITSHVALFLVLDSVQFSSNSITSLVWKVPIPNHPALPFALHEWPKLIGVMQTPIIWVLCRPLLSGRIMQTLSSCRRSSKAVSSLSVGSCFTLKGLDPPGISSSSSSIRTLLYLFTPDPLPPAVQ